MQSKVVVTGGAGFIGSHLAATLVAQGNEVHVVDDLSSGKRANLPVGVVFHQGSILDDGLLDDAFQGATVVFHQAAIPSVPRSVAAPVPSHEANASGTLAVLEAARRHDVDKVVYAASSSAYGDTVELPKHEGMVPSPRSPYAASKLAGEHYLASYHASYGLHTTSLRYFNVYGPRQDPDGAYAPVIAKFARSALLGEPLTVFGDGQQTRDFTYVDDAVQANLLAATSKAPGHTINIGSGRRTSLLELASLVGAVLGKPIRVQHLPPRVGDVRDSLASLHRAQALLGYAPGVTIEEGVRRTIEALQASPA